MIVTSCGRPVAHFPLFKFTDQEGGFLLTLSRVDVSDVRNEPIAEAVYSPLFKRDTRDGMETWEFRLFNHEIILFFAPRKVNVYASRQNHPEEE